MPGTAPEAVPFACPYTPRNMPSQTQLRPCVLRCGASGFAVDYWGHSSCVGAVFLTHAHSDHLCGLDGEWAPNGRTVFCSAITKALVLRKFPALAKRADVKIVALSQGTPTVVRLPDRSSGTLKNSKALLATLLPVSDYEKQTDTLLTVTALDAGHCPGSVSFLFEGDCGRVFHTGDWRREDWCGKGGLLGYGDGDGEKHGIGEDKPGIREQSDRKSYQCTTLPRCLTTRPIDLLLLDNTYGDEAYAFPSRKDAAATIVDLIRNKVRIISQIPTLFGPITTRVNCSVWSTVGKYGTRFTHTSCEDYED